MVPLQVTTTVPVPHDPSRSDSLSSAQSSSESDSANLKPESTEYLRVMEVKFPLRVKSDSANSKPESTEYPSSDDSSIETPASPLPNYSDDRFADLIPLTKDIPFLKPKLLKESESPSQVMEVKFPLRVKTLAQFASEASIPHTIAYDQKLVCAMRRSNAVKALVIGTIMSSIYKRAYKLIETSFKSFCESNPNASPMDSGLRLNVQELDEELRDHMNQFFGQLPEMVIKGTTGDDIDVFMAMTEQDIAEFCAFYKNFYLDRGIENLFSELERSLNTYPPKLITNSVFGNISLAVFLLKTPCFTKQFDLTYEHNYYFDTRVYYRQLCWSLLSIDALLPFIDVDMQALLSGENKEFLERPLVLLSNYVKDKNWLEKVGDVYFNDYFVESESFGFFYLGLRKCPTIREKFRVRLGKNREDYLGITEVTLMQNKGFFPICLPEFVADLSINNGSLVLNEDYIHSAIHGDYIFAVDNDSFRPELIKEAYDNGVLEFYAFITPNAYLLKRD